MGDNIARVIVIVVVVVIAFSVIGFLLKALWWLAVIAGAIVLFTIAKGKISKS